MAMNGPVFDGTRVYVARPRRTGSLFGAKCERRAKAAEMSKAFTWVSSAWGLAPSGCFEQPDGAPHPRGPAPSGVGEPAQVRLQPLAMAALKAWIAPAGSYLLVRDEYIHQLGVSCRLARPWFIGHCMPRYDGLLGPPFCNVPCQPRTPLPEPSPALSLYLSRLRCQATAPATSVRLVTW
jgi:hypothetical protein